MSHTPGPWIPDYDRRFDGAHQVIMASPPHHTIAFLACGGDDEQHRADARLIAAAPDLLAACKEALSSIAYAPTYNKMAAAIAKAEGGAK